MVVGRDLGFLFPVLVVVLFAPVVIGFVVRRKWRIAVAKREEIKRLLVLASEEAARAELEASNEYVSAEPSVSRQLHYQCAVCFCPTSTRCARCKAVRYCSGKCQIIHWRQGHKEECRPFANTDRINDVGGGSTENTINQEEYKIHGSSFESEGKQCAKPVETFPEEPAISNSRSAPEVFRGKYDNGTEWIADGKRNSSASKFTTASLSEGLSVCTTSTESSGDAAVHRVSSSHHPERLDGHNSSYIVPDKLETGCSRNLDQIKSSSTKHRTLVNPVDSFNNSGRSNQIKADFNDGDSACGSTSSSGWTVDGSNDSSFSEPSTPSSGFWEGTIIDSSGSKEDLEDSAQSSSIEVSDGNTFQSSLRFSFNSARDAVPPLHVQGSDAKQILSDDPHASTLGIKKPIEGASISEEIYKDISKTRSLPSLSSEVSKHVDIDASSDSRVLKCRDQRCFQSSVSYAHSASGSGGHSKSTDASNATSLRPLSTGRSNHMVNGMSGTKEVGSLSSSLSDARLSSGAGRRSVSSQQSGKVGSADALGGSPTQFASYLPMANNGMKTSMWKVDEQFRSSKSSSHHPSGVGSEIVRRYNNKGLFPYELFVKIYNWNKVEFSPCGLINCGNSCYANSVLQCLAFTPPLTAFLLQRLHSKACEKKGWCFTCEFENLILKAKEGNSPLSPIGILSQIHNIGSHLGNGREEDAHEFLRYAIDTMQSVCLEEAGVNASGSLEETTLIGLTFGGYLRSKIKCMKCGGKSERHEKMMDLTVEIEGDIGTLEEALRQYTGTEILDGENKYHCSRCKSYEKAKKKLTILEAPNVLTIALKRFQSGKFGKLNKAIQFPEILDLAPYVSGTSDKSPIYRLYGVVVHLDTMNAAFSGHYVCYVKNIQNKWFKIDDSTVKAVELGSVLTKRAYMLLYARCSPRAPRLIRNSIVPRDPRKIKNPAFKLRSQPSVLDPLHGQAANEPFYLDHTSLQRIRKNSEEDSSSDNSSSFSLSEEGSSSTESTRGSTGTDDFLDQIFGDFEHNWRSPCRNSSDSDASSSSSSSSSSPLYSRHSPLANLDRYDSGCAKTNDLHVAKSAVDSHDLRARLPSQISKPEDPEGKGSVPFLYSDSNKQQCRKSASRSSRWKADSEKLGWSGDIKSAGVYSRRPTG